MKNSFPESYGEGQDKHERLITVESDFFDEHGKTFVLEVDSNAPGLFLFDLDGTLINVKRVHGESIVSLFKKTFPDHQKLDFSNPKFVERFTQSWFENWGPGDRAELELLCKNFAIDFISDEKKNEILNLLVDGYGKEMEAGMARLGREEKEQMVLPGARIFLDEMKSRKIPAALVTGNVRRSAEAYLKYLDLGKYFITGGFDDDPKVQGDIKTRRSSILRSAIEKCKSKGLNFTPERMAVFGDTPKDFQATLSLGETRPYVFLLASGDHTLHYLSEVSDISTGAPKRPHMILQSLQNLKIRPFFDSLERYRE